MKRATALALALCCSVAGAKMDTQIAGRRLDDWHYQPLFNAHSGAYLFPAIDCDGAHKRIILSDSLQAILRNEGRSDEGGELEATIPWARFDPRTGLGIRLGMSRTEIIRRLGIPSQSLHSKKMQADELIYQRYTAKDKRGWYGRYANFYLFRNDRLFYIELSYDLIGGGCGFDRGVY